MAPGVKLHRAIYDLAIGPVSYDFATWLIAAEMERRQLGAERLHVVIRAARDGVDGWFRDKTSLYGAAEMHWRLWHLVLPLCHLVNASVELDPLAERGGRQTLSHHAGPIIAAARAGAAVPRFAALSSSNLVLMRSGRGAVDNVIRYKYCKRNFCDSHAVMRELGFTLEKTVTGPPERKEDVEYWRRA